MNRDDINKARIVYYGFFAAIFSFRMEESKFPYIYDLLDILHQNPVNEESALALENAKLFLDEGGYEALKHESDLIFFNPTTSYMPMTASYYHEKRDDGSKRLEMIEYVLKSSYRKNGEEFKENEDHIEFLLLFMQKLINDELEGSTPAEDLSKQVFQNILNEMLDEFSGNLHKHEKSHFYKEAAVLLQTYTDIERLYLGVDRPARNIRRDLSKPRMGKEKKAPREMVQRNLNEFGII